MPQGGCDETGTGLGGAESAAGARAARLEHPGSNGLHRPGRRPPGDPDGFLWDGERFVVCTLPHAAKVAALRADPRVALTIDTNTFPPHVLLVRGTASEEIVDGVPPEYLEGTRKIAGADQLPAFEAQVRGMYRQMARIAIAPTWA